MSTVGYSLDLNNCSQLKFFVVLIRIHVQKSMVADPDPHYFKKLDRIRIKAGSGSAIWSFMGSTWSRGWPWRLTMETWRLKMEP